MQRPILSVIAAVAQRGAIGRQGQLLVHLSEDLRRFRQTTLGCPIVMGRKTWDSIGRPLPGRRSIVVSRDPLWKAAGAESAASLDAALDLGADAERIFVIGGAQIYALALPRADELLLTEIDADFDADTWFPAWPRDAFIERSREAHTSPDGLHYSFVRYQRKSGE